LIVGLLAGAAVPAGATAESGFDTDAFPATVSGKLQSETAVFEGESLKLSCEGATFEGSLEAPAETLRVTPKYSECSALGAAGTIATTGCEYVLHSGEMTATDEFPGTADLSCAAGKFILISLPALNCEAKIEGQSGLSGMNYVDNTGSTNSFVATTSLKKLKYTILKDSFLCPFAGTGAKEDGAVSGASTITATSEGSATGIAVQQGTKLCQASEDPCKGATWGKGTSIQASATKLRISVVIGSATYDIDCQSSLMTGQVTQDKGQPRVTASVETISFSTCGVGDGIKCDIATRETPYAAWFKATGMKNGELSFRPKLRVSCALLPLYCDFVRDAKQPTIDFSVLGGKPATFEIPQAKPQPLAREKLTEEKNCPLNASFSATYSVSKPSALWVTN